LANAKELANRINRISERFLGESNNGTIPSQGSDSRIEQLMKIKELLDSGLISQSHADKLKNEIL
jgi:Asp-tRNA(Asn)/Glu-tRNA(Gln) amidotransferase B subunit